MRNPKTILMKLGTISILTVLAVLLPGCQARSEPEPFTVKYSDAVYLIRDGKIWSVKDGKPDREVSGADVEGWLVITPGLMRKLYRERVEGE